MAGCRNAWRGLRRQHQVELIEEYPLVGNGLGVAAQDESAAVGGGEVHIEHLDAGKLVEHGPRSEPTGERPEPGA